MWKKHLFLNWGSEINIAALWTRKKCYSVEDSPTGIFRHLWLCKRLHTLTFTTFPTRIFPPQTSRKPLSAKLHWSFIYELQQKSVLLDSKGMRKHEKEALKMQSATHQSCVHKVQKSNSHAQLHMSSPLRSVRNINFTNNTAIFQDNCSNFTWFALL